MNTATQPEKKDIFQRITDQIIDAIEEGTDAFRVPWRTSGGFPFSPVNAVSKRPYRGINVLVLWAIAQKRGYKSGVWATFKQWQTLGAQVRKGEKSANVIFWKFSQQEDAESEDERQGKKGPAPMAKDYWVFNADQVDGYRRPEEGPFSRAERIEQAEDFFGRLGVEIRPGGNQASYCKDIDAVFMPAFEAFKEPLYFYSVLSHESCHWTGAPARLNRNLAGRFGTDGYAMEELVAELGAAFLCAELGLPTDPRTDHAPYIATWLKVFRDDKRALFTAAGKAQEAVDWMAKKAARGQLDEAA